MAWPARRKGDDRIEAKGRMVFLDQQFRSEVARTVKRARTCRRQILGDAARRPAGPGLSGWEDQSIVA
jgi:hypothetical protein